MKKNIAFLIFALANISNANLFDGEINLGTKVTFGVDGVSPFVEQVKPIFNLIIPRNKEDYHIDFFTPANDGPENHDESIFLPNISPAKRDFDLAVKYLSEKVYVKNYLNFNLRENLLGFGIAGEFETKDKTYKNVVDDFDLEKSNISLISNNKLLNGYIKYNFKGKNEEQTDFEKDLDGKNSSTKGDIDYDLSSNIKLEKVNLSLNASGKNKDIVLTPSITYFKDEMYLGGSLILEANPEFNIQKEYAKVKYSAPGYNKIEYFKNFKKIDKEITDLNSYHADRINLDTAEISGYKGTWRLENVPSGSLYGDNPLKFIGNAVIDSIYEDPNLTNTKSFLERIEKNKSEIGLFEGIALAITRNRIEKEVGNKDNINRLINSVAKKVLDRAGFKDDVLTSKYGIYKQIPEEFKNLIPYINKDFDFTLIKPSELDPNYLYNNGFNIQLPPLKSNGIPNDTLVFGDKFRTVDVDFDRYFVKEMLFHNPLINNIANVNVTNIALDFIFNSNFTRNLRSLIEHPERIVGMDLLRGVYFHSSEKAINEAKLEEKIQESISKTDFSEFKNTSNKVSLGFHFGLNKKNYKLDLSSRLFNIRRYEKENDKVFKHTNTLTLNFENKDNRFPFKTKNFFILDNFVSRVKDDIIIFDNLELITANELKYNFKIHNDVSVNLGLEHIGHYGYIIPKKIVFNGNEYFEEVAKRDKNKKPISKDGIAIDVKVETEKTLTDKALAHASNQGKDIRKVKPRDFVATEEKKAEPHWYKVDNLLTPSLELNYDIDENIKISNTLKAPFKLNKKTLTSLGFFTNTNLKFLFNEKNLLPLISKENILKPRYSIKGDFAFSTIDTRFKKDYDVDVNFSFASLRLKSMEENIPDFKLSFNPLIADFKLNPQFSIMENRGDIFGGLGFKFNGTNNFMDFELGASRVINQKSDNVDKELVPQIKYLLKTRNEEEYDKFNEKIADLDLKNEMKYHIMPFANLNYDKHNLKFSLSYISKKAEGEKENPDRVEILSSEMQDIATLGDYNKSYLSWDYTWDSYSKYIYLVPLLETVVKKEYKRETIKTTTANYNLKFDLDYGKEVGIDFDAKMKFNFNSNSYKKYASVKDITEKIKHLYFIRIDKYQKYTDVAERFSDENKIPTFENETEARTYVDNELKRRNKGRGINKQSRTVKDAINVLLNPKTEESTEHGVIETISLNNKKIDLNLNLRLGYNLEINKNLIIGTYLENDFNLTNNILDYIIVDDFKAYGERRIEIVNNIRPFTKINYKYNDNIKFYTDLGLDFTIKNEGFSKARPIFTVGSNFKW